MKKLFAAVLALVTALSLTTLAFATDPSTDGGGEEEQCIEITVPVTVTVKKGGENAPGQAEFHFEILSLNGSSLMDGSREGVKISVTSITTKGIGDYTEYLKVTASQEGWASLSDGFIIREINDGLDGWSYDDRLWHVSTVSVMSSSNMAHKGVVHPAVYDNDAGFYRPDYTGDDYQAALFTNTYTKSSTPRYYYNSTTPTEPAPSPKTFDAGIALYAALSLTSLTGMAALGRKKF